MKYPTIAMRFSDILNLRGLRARDLAEKAKMTEGAISHYVNGNRAPGNKTAKKLADILDCNPLWLMDLSDKMEKEQREEAKKAAEDILKLLDQEDIDMILKLKDSDDEKAKMKLYAMLINKISQL